VEVHHKQILDLIEIKLMISVAMTTYNAEKYLSNQLDSILAQTRQIDELVICDDASNDATVSILNKYFLKSPFIVKIIINEKNIGYVQNFERTMNLCSGNIIVMCDHDDIWMPDKILTLEKLFIDNPDCGMAFTDAVLVDEFGVPFQSSLWRSFFFTKKLQKQIKKGRGGDIILVRNFVTGATAAVAKSFFKEALPFPVTCPHDRWLATIAAIKNRLYFSNKPTIMYRKHSGQQIGSRTIIEKINTEANYDELICSSSSCFEGLNKKKLLGKKQIDICENYIKFIIFRKTISNTFECKMIILVRFLRGDYFKYGNGFYSMAKDLLKR